MLFRSQRLPWLQRDRAGTERVSRHKAVVLGAGPVGLLGALALISNGFQTSVYSREPVGSEKSSLVASMGATYVSAADHTIQQLAEKVGNVDLVYEAVGASQIAFEMIKFLGTNGVFVFTGVPGRKMPIEVDTDLMMRNLVLKNQVIFGTVNAGREAFRAAIRDLGLFMKRTPDVVRGLITGRFPIEAHRDLLLGRAGGIKNVISLA